MTVSPPNPVSPSPSPRMPNPAPNPMPTPSPYRPAPTPDAQTNKVISDFTRIIADASDAGARLSQLSNSGKYPSASWSDRVLTIAANLDDARMGVAYLRPDAQQLVYDLGASVRTISRNSGILENMARNQSTFGDWYSTFDQPIRLMHDAVNLLLSPPPFNKQDPEPGNYSPRPVPAPSEDPAYVPGTPAPPVSPAPSPSPSPSPSPVPAPAPAPYVPIPTPGSGAPVGSANG